MNNAYFNNVVQIGNLYLEHIFYEFESEPVLFSCVDGRKNLYLCLCSDIRYGQKWIVTKCNITTLNALIEETIDIASAFLEDPDVIVIDMDLQGNESSHIIERDKIDRLDLPKEGLYLRCDKEKARNYLRNKKYEILYEQLEWTIDTTAAMEERVRLYHSIICNSAGKAIIAQLNNLSGISEPSVAIKQEYCIHTKEKYIGTTDSIEIGSTGNDDYLHAA